jgi:hypothetical protein
MGEGMTVQRICAAHGRYSGRRCEACAAERARRPKRKSAADRIRSTAAWKRAERRTIARDGDQCTYGTEIGDGRVVGRRCPVVTGLQVHHRVAIEDGGAPLDDSNLRTVCATHHARLEAESRRLREEKHGQEAEDE